jgi:transcriptional regulator with XRE-family HTH domain
MSRYIPASRKRPTTLAGRHADDIRRRVGTQIRELRTDAGISQRRLAAAARVDHGFLSQIESGLREPSLSSLAALAVVLGADLSVRLYPNTGPRIRDHIQAQIGEELLRIAHPVWSRLTEVAVFRPARGRIDLVLQRPEVVVANEIHSQMQRLEQQLGWATLKAESLPSADFWRFVDPQPEISRLLVVRSTRATRDLAVRFEATLAAAYPAPAGAVHAALVDGAAWPGAGMLWADLDRDTVRIRDRPPRGVRVGT